MMTCMNILWPAPFELLARDDKKLFMVYIDRIFCKKFKGNNLPNKILTIFCNPTDSLCANKIRGGIKKWKKN